MAAIGRPGDRSDVVRVPLIGGDGLPGCYVPYLNRFIVAATGDQVLIGRPGDRVYPG